MDFTLKGYIAEVDLIFTLVAGKIFKKRFVRSRFDRIFSTFHAIFFFFVFPWPLQFYQYFPFFATQEFLAYI